MKSYAGGALSRALSFAALLLLSILVFPGAMAASTSTTSTTTTTSSPAQSHSATPTSLAISVIPPKLPADGGSYPAVVVYLESSGGASLALNDTVVFLTSSQAGVGSISSQATISKGACFAVANFTTSTTPGTTSISASSPGLSAVSTSLTTVTLSGFATRLSVIPVPGTQVVGQSAPGIVLVEALDSTGSPAKSSSPILVTLSSSDNNVASLPNSTLTIASGSIFASTAYDVGASPGSATITASASGFGSGSGTVSLQGASPFGLALFAQPDPVATATSGRLVVTLVDSSGNPTPAPAPVSVVIASSNTTIVSVQQTVTIHQGEVYSVTSFSSASVAGNANLTASSPGLRSAFSVVTVVSPVSPVKLALEVAPNPVPADAKPYDSILVALTDASGNPALATTDTQVTLTSSDASVGNVGEDVTIAAGSSFAVATFTSTFSVGSTFITAIAQNLQSASISVASYGPTPTKVAVQSVVSKLPADGNAYSVLLVSFEDASGLPAEAPANTTVMLTSSTTNIATLNSSVILAAGSSFALANVSTTISPGVANITATASGYSSSAASFTSVSPAPSQLGFYIAPSSGIQSFGPQGDAIIAVQLQDSTSQPARARQDTPIVITSSNSSMISKPLQLDIPQGADYAWTMVKTSGPGSTVLTASSSGLSSSSANLLELSLPVSITLISSEPVIAIAATATVQLQVDANGVPVKGANVSISTTSGSMLTPGGVTDANGQFTDTFIPATNGVATVTAVVHDPALGNQTTGTNILVTSGSSLPISGATSRSLGIIGSILPILIVIVIIVVIALGARQIVKRRRKTSDEFDETKESAT